MSKCTTPPWIVEEVDAKSGFSGNNWCVCSVGYSTEYDKNYYVTTDHVHASELDGDAKYDAYLIAAAPDMGKLLLKLLPTLRPDQAELGVEDVLKKAGIL